MRMVRYFGCKTVQLDCFMGFKALHGEVSMYMVTCLAIIIFYYRGVVFRNSADFSNAALLFCATQMFLC